MKNQIYTSLIVPVSIGILFSPDTSGLFTQARAQCAANWNQGTEQGCTVSFINTSTGANNFTYYYWNFGNDQTSFLQSPSCTYSASGTYSVCLTMSVDSTCYKTLCKTVTVQCGMGIASSEQINISLSVNNPVFSSADIHYSIASSGSVELVLFDIVGNKIGVLESGNKSAGMHSYSLNTGDYSKGIYFIRLNFEGATITKKIIIVR